VPQRPGRMTLEVWMWPTGQRVALPVIVAPRALTAAAP
jgi:hypothetical protein